MSHRRAATSALLWLLMLRSGVLARTACTSLHALVTEALHCLRLLPSGVAGASVDRAGRLGASESWAVASMLRQYARVMCLAGHTAPATATLLAVLSHQPPCNATAPSVPADGGAAACEHTRVLHVEAAAATWVTYIAGVASAGSTLVVDLALGERPSCTRRRPVEPSLVHLPLLPAAGRAAPYCVSAALDGGPTPVAHASPALAADVRGAIAAAAKWCGIDATRGNAAASHVHVAAIPLLQLYIRSEQEYGVPGDDVVAVARVLRLAGARAAATDADVDVDGDGDVSMGGEPRDEVGAAAATVEALVTATPDDAASVPPEFLAAAAALMQRSAARRYVHWRIVAPPAHTRCQAATTLLRVRDVN